MYAMAEDTGGQAFVNTNDLTQAVSKAISNGSNYYTLTYSPSNMDWDARFRAIKVKVDQPGVKLTYRNGYFAVDPNDRNKLNAQGAATSLVQPTTMATRDDSWRPGPGGDSVQGAHSPGRRRRSRGAAEDQPDEPRPEGQG